MHARFILTLAAIGAASLTLAWSTALADDDDDVIPQPAFSFSWEDATDQTNRAEFDRLMARGRAELMAAAEATIRSESREFCIKAGATFGRAAKLMPEDALPHYLAGQALSAWDSIYSFPGKIDLAINHFSEFIRLAPLDSRIPSMLFARSIAYTKKGGDDNIRLALADYEARLQLENQLSLEGQGRINVGLILSNSAELHMYVGELERALELYYDSLEYAVGESAILYKYGLAVALDRDGQRERARAVMNDASRHDSRPMFQLTRPTVFFIPEGDIHYYRALGFEARGDKRKAMSYYRRFLSALPKSQYADRAKENLAELEGKPPKQPSGGTKK